MPVILLSLTKARKQQYRRPEACPHCGSQLLQRWGRVTKTVKDHDDSVAHVYRYRCDECHRTFRNYPEGLDRSYYTQGIRKLAALICMLGLTYREVTRVFEDRGYKLSRTTVWREGQQMVSQINGEKFKTSIQPFIVDQTYIHNISTKFGVVLAIDFGDGIYTILGTLNESDPIHVTSWLKPLIGDINLKVIQMGTGSLDPSRASCITDNHQSLPRQADQVATTKTIFR
jgi:DNA-directed RNA polymerase subunit RPC12/RpoP